MTAAAILTANMLQKYVGGQFKVKPPNGATCRGEIRAIVDDGRMIRVCLLWSAIKHGALWYEDSTREYALDLPNCQFRKDALEDEDVLRIDCPRLDLATVFYPKDHKKNIKWVDVKPKPNLV